MNVKVVVPLLVTVKLNGAETWPRVTPPKLLLAGVAAAPHRYQYR